MQLALILGASEHCCVVMVGKRWTYLAGPSIALAYVETAELHSSKARMANDAPEEGLPVGKARVMLPEAKLATRTPR